jgi:hypothetical protein
MATPKKELKDIKKQVENAYQYFSQNYSRFYQFKNFVFNTSLTVNDRNKLETLKKPILEANTLEAYLSKLLGEFATQEPSVEVRAADGLSVAEITPELLGTIDILESHCRHILSDVSNDNLQYNIYNDQLGGGFSTLKVYTDYIHDKSFEQKIYVDKVFDPTLCGFDPLARASHKGDGEFCFELSPYTKDAFEAEFGKEALNGITFQRNSAVNSFSWSYQGQGSEVILVCDFYVKRKVRKVLVQLANGEIGLETEYNKRVKELEESGEIMVAPEIVERRTTVVEVIDLYRFCENTILDYYPTDYDFLPLIFVDGNSVILRESTNGDSYQMTRPYVYHAEGIQRLRNFAMQTIGQQLENMLQHKIKVPIEAIPDEYKDVYKNVQLASTLVYQQYSDDGSQEFHAPQEIVQTPPPPIVETTFMGADRITQSILGNYDALLGIQGGDTSGKAIQTGAINSSMAADPYLVNYIKGLNRVLQVIVNMIPKYYKTPRSLPVIGLDGKRGYQIINDPNSPESMTVEYDANMLQIKVEASVNTAVEKQASLELITRMSAASEVFAQFINTKGLMTIVNNLEVRGVDQLKVLAEEFVQEQAETAAAQAEQPTPIEQEGQILIQLEQMRSEIKQMQMQADLAKQTAEMAIQEQKNEIELLKALASIESSEVKNTLEAERLAAENARSTIEMLKDITEAAASNIGERDG